MLICPICAQLNQEFDLLRPSLQEVQRKEEERRLKAGGINEVIGRSQAAELTNRTTKESVLIFLILTVH